MPERPQSILVIEDDPAVAEALVEGIGDEGYDVHWEATGAGGVAHARDRSPQLIVLDVRLPDGSGFDFCRQMRQLGLRQPILMLTVQADEVDKVLGLEMGADDYLTKPYRLRELIARIRSLLRRAYGELASPESVMRPHVPPMLRISAGMTPSRRARSNGSWRYGLKRSSSLPVVSTSQHTPQSP